MLGRAIYVHSDHIVRMSCPGGCLGVELDNDKNLHAEEHRGCAVCELAARMAVPAGTRTLRQCPGRLCHGRFRQTSYDEFRIDERWSYAKQMAASLIGKA